MWIVCAAVASVARVKLVSHREGTRDIYTRLPPCQMSHMYTVCVDVAEEKTACKGELQQEEWGVVPSGTTHTASTTHIHSGGGAEGKRRYPAALPSTQGTMLFIAKSLSRACIS